MLLSVLCTAGKSHVCRFESMTERHIPRLIPSAAELLVVAILRVPLDPPRNRSAMFCRLVCVFVCLLLVT